MVEGIVIGFSDMLSIAQTIGIVGTMVLTLFFSKKQIQSLSIDTQTRGLNDLGEKYLKMVERAMEDPSIQGVINNEVKLSREGAYSFYILWICSHAYAIRKRNVLILFNLSIFEYKVATTFTLSMMMDWAEL